MPSKVRQKRLVLRNLDLFVWMSGFHNPLIHTDFNMFVDEWTRCPPKIRKRENIYFLTLPLYPCEYRGANFEQIHVLFLNQIYLIRQSI